eukprot:scaffold71690_cov32-Tisochrysis_lutea.AAC.6
MPSAHAKGAGKDRKSGLYGPSPVRSWARYDAETVAQESADSRAARERDSRLSTQPASDGRCASNCGGKP